MKHLGRPYFYIVQARTKNENWDKDLPAGFPFFILFYWRDLLRKQEENMKKERNLKAIIQI